MIQGTLRCCALLLRLVVLLGSFLLLGYGAAGATERTVFQKDSLYQHISVVEDSASRERMIINNRKDLVQGRINLDAPDRLAMEYSRMAFVSLAYLGREPQEILFIGLGAGTMPRWLNRFYPNAEIDAVEIDPDIVEVAKKYFYFKDGGNIRVHVNDGRVFLKRTKKKYDIIFLDAYQGGEIPFHLTTVEFLREVKSHLKERGVAVSNILSQFKNRFFDSMVATHEAVFPLIHIYKGQRSHNFIFVAGSALRSPKEVLSAAQGIQSSRKLDIDMAGTAMSAEDTTHYASTEKVLTDDFAPVNLYQHMKSK